MIDNNQRRGAAKALRERTKRPLGKSMQLMFSETLGLYRTNIGWAKPTETWANIVNYLADLIDRPTCKNLATKPADELFCGEHVDIAYMENTNDYHAQFCPTCGTEIYNGD